MPDHPVTIILGQTMYVLHGKGRRSLLLFVNQTNEKSSQPVFLKIYIYIFLVYEMKAFVNPNLNLAPVCSQQNRYLAPSFVMKFVFVN